MPSAPSTARDAAVRIVQTLRDAGHVAYFAGGCVRDRLLGIEPKDYDVATDAPPQAVRSLFRQSRFVGEAFGVVLVRIDHRDVEVATFRTEWAYVDGRRPGAVEFSDARHDAQRRDFTINGLFEDPLAPPERAIIDHVGGRADLEARVLRAIGVADERFAEDFLRMLRAVRFTARLGFSLDPDTAAAIRRHAPSLARISRERIGQEVGLMLRAPSRSLAAGLIQSLTLDAPTLQEPHADAALPTLAAVVAAPLDSPRAAEGDQAAADVYPLALAAWMLDRHLFTSPATPTPTPEPAVPMSGPRSALAAALEQFSRSRPALVRRWRTALCLSNDERDALDAILSLLPLALDWPSLGLAPRKRFLARVQRPAAVALLAALATHRADARPASDALAADAPVLLAQGVAPTPWLTGEDLIARGLQPGPAFKRLLEAAYDYQLEGHAPDRDAALAWLDHHL